MMALSKPSGWRGRGTSSRSPSPPCRRRRWNRRGGIMVEDLIATWQELGNMLADVGETYGDLHPDVVIAILDDCALKATELTQQIVARRAYVEDIRALMPVTQSEA